MHNTVNSSLQRCRQESPPKIYANGTGGFEIALSLGACMMLNDTDNSDRHITDLPQILQCTSRMSNNDWLHTMKKTSRLTRDGK